MNITRRLMNIHPSKPMEFGSALPTALPPAVPIRCAGLEIGGHPLPQHPGMASFRGMVDIAAGLGFEVLYINHRAPHPSARLWDPLYADISVEGLHDLPQETFPPLSTNNRETKLDILWKAFLNFWNHRTENPSRWKSYKAHWKDDPAWKQDLSEYQVASEVFGQDNWKAWPDSISPAGLRKQVDQWKKNAPEVVEAQLDFFAYTQWILSRQWSRLSDYAHLRGVDLATNIFVTATPGAMETFFQSDAYQNTDHGAIPRNITSTILNTAKRLEGLFDILYLADAASLQQSGHDVELRAILKHPELDCRILLPNNDSELTEAARMRSAVPCACIPINEIAKELNCAHLLPDPDRMRRSPNWRTCQQRIHQLLEESNRISHRHITQFQPTLAL